MKHVASLDLSTASTSVDLAGHDTRAPGERYFRHPGDVVRCTLAALAVALLVLFVGARHPHQRRCERRPRPRRGRSTRRAARAAARGCADRRAGRAGARGGRARVPTAVAASGRGHARRDCRRGGVRAPGPGVRHRCPRPRRGDRRHLDRVDRLPVVDLRRRCRRGRDRRDAVALAVVAAVPRCSRFSASSRCWRIAGTAGVPELLLALATGVMAGAAVLIVVGAPNRRPAPAVVVVALRDAGLAVDRLALERADGGRAQLYTATLDDGGRAFVKVYARDSRDADLLYRELPHAAVAGPERRPARR